MWTNILDMEMLVGTYVWIDFFSQNADLFGWQLREQLVYVELVIFTQVLAVQLGRGGGHGGGLFRRRLWRTTEKDQYYYRGWKKKYTRKALWKTVRIWKPERESVSTKTAVIILFTPVGRVATYDWATETRQRESRLKRRAGSTPCRAKIINTPRGPDGSTASAENPTAIG